MYLLSVSYVSVGQPKELYDLQEYHPREKKNSIIISTFITTVEHTLGRDFSARLFKIPLFNLELLNLFMK